MRMDVRITIVYDNVAWNKALLPPEEVRRWAGAVEVIGDAGQVSDIYTAVHSGYNLAWKHQLPT